MSLLLARTGKTTTPGKLAAFTDTQNREKPIDGEFFFRFINEFKPHRLPFFAKIVAARFTISGSCRRISFSLRRRAASFFKLSVNIRRLVLLLKVPCYLKILQNLPPFYRGKTIEAFIPFDRMSANISWSAEPKAPLVKAAGRMSGQTAAVA